MSERRRDRLPVASRVIVATTLAVALGCSDSGSHDMAMCALLDVSGTYADELPSVVNIVRSGILPEMLPGDSLFLITIDGDSYDEENLVASVTLDRRPTRANSQKLAFAGELAEIAENPPRSMLTDISGAMMLCGDYLGDTAAGIARMFIFSDMKEELPRGTERSFAPQEFAGIDVAAMNVIKLEADNVQPEIYRKRLAEWEQRVLAAGAASWSIVVDPGRLSDVAARR